ncbi:spore germination protein [Bacillus timonensis]|nr:spore germination protein [Bacillus timonensis]
MSKKLIYPNIEQNLSYINHTLGTPTDLLIRQFTLQNGTKCFVCGIRNLIQLEIITEHVIEPLLKSNIDLSHKLSNHIEQQIVELLSVTSVQNRDTLIEKLLQGSTLLFIDGVERGFALSYSNPKIRDITEPISDTVVRGPKEGFVELIEINLSMLRRRLRTPSLRVERLLLGETTKTETYLVYLENIANKEVLEELRIRLSRIKIDAILESNYVEEFIEDSPFSLFPSVANSERPDTVASRLLEGRIAILVDGTPMVLTVPHLWLESFQSAEDYYNKPYYSSFIRIVRFFSFIIATILPALYVSTGSYHQEFIPTDLLLTYAGSRDGVPFPLFLEVFILLLAFDFLKEAGLRMPKPIGEMVSVVGGLIIGQAAVNAGFVSAPTIIIVAISGIATYMLPSFSSITVILRFSYLVAAALLGFYGVMLVVCFLALHTSSLRSFGVPYMSPIFPSHFLEWRDFLTRFPLWAHRNRPKTLNPTQQIRQAKNQMPRKLKDD